MKKKLFNPGLTLLIALMMVFITTSSFGQDKKEKRDVSGFSEISVSISADVYISQGDKEELIIEGDEDALEEIETEVRGNELKIKYDGPFHFKSIEKVKVYVTAKEIEEINVSGSADLIAKTKISSREMDINVSGSGKIEIGDLETDEIEATISGSGNIFIGGSKAVSELDISISGSGDLDSENIEIKEAEINVSGSGGCKVHVTEELEVAISGSGKVYYKGSPMVNADISGSGKVKSMN
jgi:hypothetical protein